MPPVLMWGLGHGSDPVEGLPDKSPRVRGELDAQLVFYIRADDAGGLTHLSLAGIGTFRCSTRDGRWTAPYDIIVPLEDADASVMLAAARAHPETYAHLAVPLQVAQLSCGHHPVPGLAAEQELVPLRGTVLLRAYAVDMAGLSAESLLTLVVRPSGPDRQLATLAAAR